MSRSNRTGANNKAANPKSYRMELVVVRSTNTKGTGNIPFQFDITSAVASIEVLESIDSPGIIITLGIGDSINLIEKIKLSGSEELVIKLSRDSNTKGKEKLAFKCRIAEIFNYTRLKAGMQTYQLRCVSEHMYNNQLNTLRRSFQGTIGDIVSNILSSDLQVRIPKPEVDKSTKDTIKGIFPRLRPVDSINWLMRNAYSNGTQFYFYETLADGIKFKSYKDMVDKDIYEEYNYTPFKKEGIEQETDEGYEQERLKCVSMNSDYNVSKYTSSSKGAYASTLHTIDIGKKEYTKTIYNYDNHISHSLNKHKPFGTTERAQLLDRTFNEHKESKNYFVNLNSSAFDKHSNYHSPGGDIDLPKSLAYVENLNYMQHEIEIPGDFGLTVGMKIKLNVTKAQEESKGSQIDKLQSGVYLVTEIQHNFNDGFMQLVRIQKDSSEVSLDATE